VYDRRMKGPMIRVNYHLTKGQVTSLKMLSRTTGLTVAELIRRAVDQYVKGTRK